MASDGILMNLQIENDPIFPKQIFHGGRWRDRLIAKKCAAKRAGGGKGQFQPSTTKLSSQNKRDISGENILSSESPIVPKRWKSSFENAKHITDSYGDVPTYKESPSKDKQGKIKPEGFAGENSQERIETKTSKSITETTNQTRSAFISGKLPAGSISNGSLNTENRRDFTFKQSSSTEAKPKKKKFEDEPNSNFNTKAPGSRDMSRKPGQVISSLFSYNPSMKTKFTEKDWEINAIKPSNAPLSAEMETFTALGLSTRLAAHLSTKLQMEAPTAIQKEAIPLMIKGDNDAFLQAETGSGKTLAYLLPIVQRIISLSSQGNQVHRDSGLFAIILAPTRELCKQIATVLDKILRCATWIVGTTVIGGESKQSEKSRLRKGINILIATPGRMLDHLDSTEVLKVDALRWLVLDEGDRLMELGFEEEIRKIVDRIDQRNIIKKTPNLLVNDSLPKRRVTILCSATMKMNVLRLGEISLKDALHIVADPTSENISRDIEEENSERNSMKKFSAPAQLQQAYAIVPAKLRLVTLAAILKRAFLRRGSIMKAIVFISCADSVDFHFSLFSRPTRAFLDDQEKIVSPQIVVDDEITKDTVAHGITLSSGTDTISLHRLHGSLPQNIRTATLKAFSKSMEPCVLLCTDVASRGLDLPNVDYVIEYDPPFCADDHLHRVGRTARAGKNGQSLIFLLPGEEEEYVSILASNYKEGKKALTLNTSEDLLRKGFGGFGKEWEERATNWQLDVERWAQDSPKYLEMARRGFQSHIRAYATHVASERHIFNIQKLHLGHLAKSFALRDKPSSIKVPGLRPSKTSKVDRGVTGHKTKRDEMENKAPEGERIRKQRKLNLDLPKLESDDAFKRMKQKIQEHMCSASEFNII